MGRIDAESETLIPIGGSFDVAGTLKANSGGGGWSNSADHAAAGYMIPVAHSLRADGFDASEDGTGRGTPLVACFDERQVTSRANRSQCKPDVAGTMHEHPFTLAIRGRDGSHDLEYRQDGVANAILTPNGGRAGIGVGAVAFANTAGDTDIGYRVEQAPPITGRHGDPGIVMHRIQVRRLTPRECERLQGFPDDYTLIPYRGKLAADGPRYKALGNSMAVPVMAWIGRRMQMVEELCDEPV